MLQGKDLLRVKTGQTVVSVCGPSDHPIPGLCSRMGVVIGTETNRWGTQLNVKWDDFSEGSVLSLQTQDESGIGVYVYPELIV